MILETFYNKCIYASRQRETRDTPSFLPRSFSGLQVLLLERHHQGRKQGQEQRHGQQINRQDTHEVRPLDAFVLGQGFRRQAT